MKREKMKTRGMSIKSKVLLISALIIVLLSLLLGISSYRTLSSELVQMGVDQAGIAATVSAFQLDGDLIRSLAPGDEGTEGYLQQLDLMRHLKEDCGVAYLYTLWTDGQDVYYGIDSDDGSSQSRIGAEFDYNYEELKEVFGGKPYVQDYIEHTEDGALITSYMPIFGSDGSVAAILGSDYDASNIEARLRGTLFKTILMTAAGLILALVILGVFVNQILKNLSVVNEKIYELVNSEGDLTKTLDVKTGDELELMADNMNALLGYIREIMLRISHDSLDLGDSTKSIAGSLTSVNDHIVDVSATMEEMSAAMEETTASLNQVNESVVKIYERIHDISAKAQNGSGLTEEIQGRARGIYEEADREQKNAGEEAERMALSVKEKIEQSKSVEEINVLTENIINITSQTNLLALNASIEAARAGEAGRGFAVVADEIGNLADDSAKAAEQIRKVSAAVIESVEGLAAESETMIRFMKDSIMQGYGKLLAMSRDYHKDAEHINETMEEFAEDSNELQLSMDSIKESIEAINVAVEESAKGVVSTAEAAGSLTESMGEIGRHAQDNKQVAAQLGEEVSRFRLE